MADEDDRARIIRDHLLQKIQSFQIQIVGGFVQHQEVGGLGQRPRQHQPPALAARKNLDRRAGLLGREQEILEIAHDVLALAGHVDEVAAPVRHGFRKRPFVLQAVAALVEGG